MQLLIDPKGNWIITSLPPLGKEGTSLGQTPDRMVEQWYQVYAACMANGTTAGHT